MSTPSHVRFVELAEQLVRDLEASTDPEKRALLPDARRALRAVQTPRPPRRTRKSEEVLRHQHRQILRAVAEAEATGDL